MSAITDSAVIPSASPTRRALDKPMGMRFILVFLAVIAGALFFMAYSIYRDMSAAGAIPQSALPYVLLGLAMLIALAFEFVNGFHDTANAVATVIYTHSLPP
jgi:PiT family inorganic phosphate transporter